MKTTDVRRKPSKYRNLDAAGCIRRFQRVRFLLTGIAVALIILTAAVFITHTEELSLGLYFIVILLILLVFFAALALHVAGVYQILYTDCDPVKFLEVLGRQSRKLKRPSQKSSHHLLCAAALSYLEDWDAVYRELVQFQAPAVRNRSLLYSHLNLLGDYCLVKDQKDDFEACRRQLLALEEQGKPREKKLADQLLLVWDRRIACVTQDRKREREILNQLLLGQKRYLSQEVAWTFRLAQLDLLDGNVEQAGQRLRFVMEYGNTMAARTWAEELWNRQDWSLEQKNNQEETGEKENGSDTE